ncbi:HAMP domain-containing histidine kinase [Brumimicrobium glaciale]|uniref:histidine kinase n=1 Tax=Brumimicrobium glaciale TaxID=200475 RepID=A0A4Q4KPU7_9FLAO|nr:HAMP domain-containing sensor histidine kinase [Brumimicrobium glaciale]RYM35568.1 HAMP domain-containing histidine kinase [Brumimicrobium glaciale]
MRKIQLKHIVILISTALIALVILQLYQAFQLYEKKSEELNNHIENVMSKVVIRHEKASDLERYTSFFGKDFSGEYKQALKQEFQNLVPVRESVSIKDTLIYENGRDVKYLQITGDSYDSLTHVSAKHSVLARDISELSSFVKEEAKSENSQQSSNELAFQLDKRVVNSLFKKSKYINELMISAFRNNNEFSPSERVNLAFLDSMISKTFEVEGLETVFNYAITDQEDVIVEFPSYTDRYNLNIDTTRSKEVRLFPGNLFDEDLTLHILFPATNSVLFQEMWLTLLVSILLVLLVVTSFIVMFKTIVNQKRLAEVKNDFISNMTHEFKTPISTISLACEALSDSDMTKNDLSSVTPFIKMIDEENKRLGGLVEQILKTAVLDRGEIKMKRDNLELNEIVSRVVAKSKIRIPKGGIRLEQAPGLMPFIGDEVHSNNLVSNLIDNAIKYSKQEVDIFVKTEKLANDQYRLTVQDSGIGIKGEHLDKIFDKLYRVPTGNVHNVKGYGLGLNYVKAIVDVEGWKISVKSKFGEGSTFVLIINKSKENE